MGRNFLVCLLFFTMIMFFWNFTEEFHDQSYESFDQTSYKYAVAMSMEDILHETNMILIEIDKNSKNPNKVVLLCEKARIYIEIAQIKNMPIDI